MVFTKIQFTHLQSDSFQTTLKAQQNHTPTQSMTTQSIKKKEQNQLDRLAEFQHISGKIRNWSKTDPIKFVPTKTVLVQNRPGQKLTRQNLIRSKLTRLN